MPSNNLNINNVLYLTANRGTGFVYTGFPENPYFNPEKNYNEHTLELRAALHLDDPPSIDVDFIYHAAISAILSVPSLAGLFQPNYLKLSDPFVDDEGLLVYGDAYRLTNVKHAGAFYKPRFPVDIRYRITRENATRLKVEYLTSHMEESFQIVSDTGVDVHGNYPLWLRSLSTGVESTLVFKSELIVGASFYIKYFPKFFPFAEAIAAAENKVRNLEPLLIVSGLYDAYRLSNDLSDKFAVLATLAAIGNLYTVDIDG
jgi:hypothetical protein